jgi:hypothetical protein
MQGLNALNALSKMYVHVLFRHGSQRFFAGAREINQERKDKSIKFFEFRKKVNRRAKPCKQNSMKTTIVRKSDRPRASRLRRSVLRILLALVCVVHTPILKAVSPTPDGLYFGANTAEGGAGALFSLTTGTNNTAVGSQALYSVTTGSQNTATGAQALRNNTGDRNTADGFQALIKNTIGNSNTAEGWRALFKNTTGDRNTANGREALVSNTTGFENTGTGGVALFKNTTGHDNTATGFAALNNNTTGALNTANGTGSLVNNNGNLNVALGFGAGANLATGDNNIYVGNIGVATESNIIRIGTEVAVTDQFGVVHPAHTATYIAGINGAEAIGGEPVFITSTGKLGTVGVPSSARFKDDIKPMNDASEAILALKPVRFHYKKELDPKGILQFGLVAEEVEKVAPDLVKRDCDGNLQTVRYDAVNAMLLNEFLKEHRKVEQLQSTVAKLMRRLDEQESKMQKMTDQLETGRPAPHVVANP